MNTQMETRLRKLEAARPEAPLAGFTLAELKAARDELADGATDQPMTPLLQSIHKAWRSSK